MEIGTPNYLNIYKSQYKFIKKINNFDVTIKSTITKRTISRKKKVVETIKTKKKKKEEKMLMTLCRAL